MIVLSYSLYRYNISNYEHAWYADKHEIVDIPIPLLDIENLLKFHWQI